jgi:hypothetical protein
MKTVQQIAADNHLHPVQVTQSNMQMLEWASGFLRVAGAGVRRRPPVRRRRNRFLAVY